MNVKNVANNITIRPTDRKMKQIKRFATEVGLPKEMPIEKKIYLEPLSAGFERIKEGIQLAIDNMKRQG